MLATEAHPLLVPTGTDLNPESSPPFALASPHPHAPTSVKPDFCELPIVPKEEQFPFLRRKTSMTIFSHLRDEISDGPSEYSPQGGPIECPLRSSARRQTLGSRTNIIMLETKSEQGISAKSGPSPRKPTSLMVNSGQLVPVPLSFGVRVSSIECDPPGQLGNVVVPRILLIRDRLRCQRPSTAHLPHQAQSPFGFGVRGTSPATAEDDPPISSHIERTSANPFLAPASWPPRIQPLSGALPRVRLIRIGWSVGETRRFDIPVPGTDEPDADPLPFPCARTRNIDRKARPKRPLSPPANRLEEAPASPRPYPAHRVPSTAPAAHPLPHGRRSRCVLGAGEVLPARFESHRRGRGGQGRVSPDYVRDCDKRAARWA
ncbi:hypothetical protein BDK51DRAFT_49774 [Blyttiomyces helicus]|uniref:Uncharacterized protein n=1 Tax=Blyttiomyces helicus TaxID=388810 RepID=A0A4P9WQ00_9FUNG|nr:hypothetical protein BDK51DRAFT_49774 [Blyttiomyces helicus]|eukprot:RKO92916.1 hypothetical protein BDK51DRAFT_49774 [Blyttiomyces helicus]